MPLMGICSAIVGNAFPVAGGVVFVPMLLVLGEPIHAAVSYGHRELVELALAIQKEGLLGGQGEEDHLEVRQWLQA